MTIVAQVITLDDQASNRLVLVMSNRLVFLSLVEFEWLAAKGLGYLFKAHQRAGAVGRRVVSTFVAANADCPGSNERHVALRAAGVVIGVEVVHLFLIVHSRGHKWAL